MPRRDTELERDNCAVALLVELWSQALPPATEGCPTAGYGSRVRLLWRSRRGPLHVVKRHPRDVVRTAGQALVTSGGRTRRSWRFLWALEHDDAIRAENATHGMVMVPVKDAATNVTAKLLYSLHYFSQRDFTQYQGEDDVYLFADRLMANLRAVDAARQWALGVGKVRDERVPTAGHVVPARLCRSASSSSSARTGVT